MDIIEGRKVPLKVAGIPVGWAEVKTNEDGTRLIVVWEGGEGVLPLPVFNYELEEN